MKHIQSYLAFLVLVAIFNSCAAWRSEDVIEVGEYPNESTTLVKKLKTSVKLSFYEVYDEKELQKDKMKEKDQKKMKELVKKAYEESDSFDLVEENSPSKELSVEVSILRQKKSHLFSDILTAATLYLVPKRTSEKITLTTKFFNKKQQLIGMVEKVESVVVWHQIFMIFAFPFNIPSSVIEETITDLTRSSILEAMSEGHFIEFTEEGLNP